jgi:hypothetical protein
MVVILTNDLAKHKKQNTTNREDTTERHRNRIFRFSAAGFIPQIQLRDAD